MVRNPFYVGKSNNSNEINQINQSGFHQRQSLNEHEINEQIPKHYGLRSVNSISGDLTQIFKNKIDNLKEKKTKGQRAHSSSQNRCQNKITNSTNKIMVNKTKDSIQIQGRDSIGDLINKADLKTVDVNSNTLNENIQTNKLRQFPQKNKQKSLFSGQIKEGQNFQGKLSDQLQINESVKNLSNQRHTETAQYRQRNNSVQKQIGSGNSSTALVLENMMRQIDQQRKQLDMKEQQMNQLNIYVSQVINENDQLRLKLQIQERNNQILIRQLNQLRQLHLTSTNKQNHLQSNQLQGYTYLRQPRKPSGRINQKLNHKDQTFENNSDFGGFEGVRDGEVDEDHESQNELEDIKNSPRFNNCDENCKTESNSIKGIGLENKDDPKIDDEDEHKDEEGQRRLINVNKLPHLQSNKNQALDLKKSSSMFQKLDSFNKDQIDQHSKSQETNEPKMLDSVQIRKQLRKVQAKDSSVLSYRNMGESHPKSKRVASLKGSVLAVDSTKGQNELDEDDEDILPSISSARQTDRRIHLNNSGGGAMMDHQVYPQISLTNVIKMQPSDNHQVLKEAAAAFSNHNIKNNKFQEIKLSQFLSASNFTSPNQGSLIQQRESFSISAGLAQIIEPKTIKSKDDSFIYQTIQQSKNNELKNQTDSQKRNPSYSKGDKSQKTKMQRPARQASGDIGYTQKILKVPDQNVKSQSTSDLLNDGQIKFAASGSFQTQNVNSFIPPTRASQFLKQRVKGGAHKTSKDFTNVRQSGSSQNINRNVQKQQLNSANMAIISSGKIAQKNNDFSFDDKMTSNGGLEGNSEMLSSRRHTPLKVTDTNDADNQFKTSINFINYKQNQDNKQKQTKSEVPQDKKGAKLKSLQNKDKADDKQQHSSLRKGGQRLISKIVNKYLNKRSKSLNDHKRKTTSADKWIQECEIDQKDQEQLVQREMDNKSYQEEVDLSVSDHNRQLEENFKGTNEIRETRQEQIPNKKTNQNMDKIQINKVNEMDIKVSRFEKHSQKMNRQQQVDNVNYLGTHQRISPGGEVRTSMSQTLRNEESIPNEEPLIQIRQFSGGGASSSIYQQNNGSNFIRTRISGQLPQKPIRNSDLYAQQRHLFIKNGAERRAYFCRGQMAFPQTNNLQFAASDKVALMQSNDEAAAISDPPPSLQPQFLKQWNMNQNNDSSSQTSGVVLDDSTPSNLEIEVTKNKKIEQIKFPRNNFFQNQNQKMRGNRHKTNMLYRIEERKEESINDNIDSSQERVTSLDASIVGKSKNQPHEKKAIQPHCQKYQQQQLYINQLHRRQQQISNVKGDKGNDTINDIDEDAEQNDFEQNEIITDQHINPEIESNPSSQISSSMQQLPMSEHPFDNIDNIDVNIDENLTMSQAEQIRIRNIQNLCNQNLFRLYSNHRQKTNCGNILDDIQKNRNRHGRNKILEGDKSQDSNILIQSSIGMGVGHINNSLFNVGLEVNNQSFSQMSQMGENIAESRDYDNQINQIRISHRNFLKHTKHDNNSVIKDNQIMERKDILENVSDYQRSKLNSNMSGQELRQLQIFSLNADQGQFEQEHGISQAQANNQRHLIVQHQLPENYNEHFNKIGAIHNNRGKFMIKSGQIKGDQTFQFADEVFNGIAEENLCGQSKTTSFQQLKHSSNGSSLMANVNDDIHLDKSQNADLISNQKQPKHQQSIQTPLKLDNSLMDQLDNNEEEIFSLGGSPAKNLKQRIDNQFSERISRQNSENLLLSEQNQKSVCNISQLQSNLLNMKQQQQRGVAAVLHQPQQRLSFGMADDDSNRIMSGQEFIQENARIMMVGPLVALPSSQAGNGSSQDCNHTSQMSSSSSVSILNAPNNTSVRIGANGNIGQIGMQRVNQMQQIQEQQLRSVHVGNLYQQQAQSIPQSQASVASANGGMMMRSSGASNAPIYRSQSQSNGDLLRLQSQGSSLNNQQQFSAGHIHGPITFNAFQGGRLNRVRGDQLNQRSINGVIANQANNGTIIRQSEILGLGVSNINHGSIQASQGINIERNIGQMPVVGAIGGMSGLSGQAIRGEGMLQFDDMGLDEYDVADERQHEIGFDRWEINLDSMSYEDLLRLQERIGYVNKGLDYNKIMSFPKMTKQQLKKYLKDKQTIKRNENLKSKKLISKEQMELNRKERLDNQIDSNYENNIDKNYEENGNELIIDNTSTEKVSKQIKDSQQPIYDNQIGTNQLSNDYCANHFIIESNQIDPHLIQHQLQGRSRQVSRSFNGQNFQSEPQSKSSINRNQAFYNDRFEEEKVAQDLIDQNQNDMQHIPNFGLGNRNQQQLCEFNTIQPTKNEVQNKQLKKHLTNIEQQQNRMQMRNNISQQLILATHKSNDDQIKMKNQQKILKQGDGMLMSERGIPLDNLSQESSIISFTERQTESAKKQAIKDVMAHDFNINRQSIKSSQQPRQKAHKMSLTMSVKSPLVKTPKMKQSYLENHDSQSSMGLTGQTSQMQIDNCAICFDLISDQQFVKVLQPCNHYFHNDCINQWLIIEKKCPMCMNILDSLSMSENVQNQSNNHLSFEQRSRVIEAENQNLTHRDMQMPSQLPRAPIARSVNSGLIMPASQQSQQQMEMIHELATSQMHLGQQRQMVRYHNNLNENQ